MANPIDELFNIKTELVFQDAMDDKFIMETTTESFVPFSESDPAMKSFNVYKSVPRSVDVSPTMETPRLENHQNQPVASPSSLSPVLTVRSTRLKRSNESVVTAPTKPPRSPLGSPSVGTSPPASTRPVPKKTSFICKLESMLENEPQFFNWSPNGKAIVIRGLHCENFGKMLAKYRSSPKPATFLRNLNTYNFKKMPSITAGSLVQQGTSLADQYEVYANPAFTRDFKDIAVLHSAVYRDSRKESQKRSDARQRQLEDSRKDAEIARLKTRVAQLEHELANERAAKRSRTGSSLDSDSWSEADSGCRLSDLTDFERQAQEFAGPSPALLADIDMEKIVSEWMTYKQ